MKLSLVLSIPPGEVLVLPVSGHPADGRVKIEHRSFTVYIDHYEARQLAGALRAAAQEVELNLREEHRAESPSYDS